LLDFSSKEFKTFSWEKINGSGDLPKVDKEHLTLFIDKTRIKFKMQKEFWDFINTYLQLNWQPFKVGELESRSFVSKVRRQSFFADSPLYEDLVDGFFNYNVILRKTQLIGSSNQPFELGIDCIKKINAWKFVL
jgi:hypothetical protein